MGSGLLLALQGPAFSAAREGYDDEVLFASIDLRIYRTLDRRGNPTIVLTNLDDAGERLDPRVTGGSPTIGRTFEVPEPPAERRGAAAGRHQEIAEGQADPGPVRVVVRGDGAERPAGEGEVEVTTETGGSTTIVININNNPPPQTVVPAVYTILSTGGLPGPFRYPDRQPFLGYGTRINSPSWFGGLGLNAGNGFGLRGGKPCGNGFDCMFGPEPDRP